MTLIVNLYGGPGSGKSTTAAGVFSQLKINNINCELVTEFAKDLTWENRTKTLQNQIYIFAKQHHRLWRLPSDLDVIVTDSPLVLNLLYSDNMFLNTLVLSEFTNMKNMNVFLTRTKKYNTSGRNQSKEEAIQLDVNTKQMLQHHDIPFITIPGDVEAIYEIVTRIEEQL